MLTMMKVYDKLSQRRSLNHPLSVTFLCVSCSTAGHHAQEKLVPTVHDLLEADQFVLRDTELLAQISLFKLTQTASGPG